MEMAKKCGQVSKNVTMARERPPFCFGFHGGRLATKGLLRLSSVAAKLSQTWCVGMNYNQGLFLTSSCINVVGWVFR